MFEGFINSIKRSWSLTKKSYQVLMLDKELMVFPLVAGVFGLLTFLTFVFPLIIFEETSEILLYIALFAFYFVSYFITIFFNTALIGAANIRLNGGDPTVSDGINIALKRLVPILSWTLVAATVGILLQSLSRKSKNNPIAGLVIRMIGGAWNIITFFVIPLIAIEGHGPFKAIKESTNIVKTKFGETMIGQMGLGLIQGIIILATIVVGAVIVFAASMVLGPSGFLFGILFAVLSIALVSIFMSALNSVFIAALYNYAKTGKDPENWNLTSITST